MHLPIGRPAVVVVLGVLAVGCASVPSNRGVAEARRTASASSTPSAAQSVPKPGPPAIACTLPLAADAYTALRAEADLVGVIRYDGMRQVSRQPQPASGASGKRTLWEYTVSVEEAVESRVETTDTITILSIETEGEDPFLLPGRSIAFIARAADDTSGTRMLVLSGFHGMVQISADDTLSRRCPANVAGGTSWQQADGTAVGKRTADFIDMLRGRPQPASNHE